MTKPACYIGCAGWNLPKELRDPHLGYLERYATLYSCVEINSSFYKHHQPKTYARWAKSVPDNFRFSVKIPKTITHRFENIEATAARFIGEVAELGSKLGPLLMQFPPKATFDADMATRIFRAFKEKACVEVVCEPRHPTWFNSEARKVLDAYSISLVGADPKPVTEAVDIFLDEEIRYFRLHGAPRIYYSEYSNDFLEHFRRLPALGRRTTWVIFDNTALGCAYSNALTIRENPAL